MSSLTTSRSSALPRALVTVSVLRPGAMTAFPAARAALVILTPIPRPAPVTNQTFLSVIFSFLQMFILTGQAQELLKKAPKRSECHFKAPRPPKVEREETA